MSNRNRGSIIIVDDEVALMTVLVEALTEDGYAVRGFSAPAQALEALQLQGCEVLLTDLMMPGMGGIALLQAAHLIDPNLVGIIMTGQGTVQTAVEAMKTGAYDYVLKPFKLAAILPVLDRAIDLGRLRSENFELRETAAIHALSQAVALTLDKPGILAKTMAAVAEQTEGDEVSILLLTPAGDELEVAAAQGAGRAALVGERVALGQDIAGWVAQNREPLILNGSVRDSRFQPRSARPEIHSAVSLPMLSGGTLVGVLSVNRLHAGWVFSTGQLKALEIVANTAAAALRSAGLLEAAQASARRFRALVEHSADGVVMTGADGLLKYVSPSSQRILGYSSAEAVGTDAAGYIHPDDLPGVLALLGALARQPGQVATARYRFRHKSGAWCWLEASINNLLAEPAVEAFVFNYRDVSEQVETAAALAARETRFRALIENSADAIALFGPDGAILYGSPATARILGYALDEFVGRNAFELIHPDHHAAVGKKLAEALAHPRAGIAVTAPVLHKDGSWRWLEGIFTNLLDEPGVHAIVNNYRDVTESRQADERVRFQANLLDRIGQAVIATDLEGHITFWNQQAETLYGWTAAEVIGRSVVDVTPSQMSQAQSAEIMRLLGAGQSWEGEFTLQRRDGATFPAQVTDSPVHNEQGALIGIIGVSADITQRKQAEAAMARTNDLLTQAEQLGHIGGWETEIAGGREVWSDGIFRILGLEPGAYPAALDNYLEHVHPDDRERVLLADHAAGQAQAPLELEYRIVRPDGQVRDVYSRSETRPGAEGQQARRLGVNMDITERKQAEAAMARTNELLSGAERVGNIGSWELDVASGREVWSEGLCRILGVPWHAADNTFAEYLERVHPDDRQRILAAALSTDHNLAPLEVEYRVVRPDGQVRDIYSRSETRLGADGQRERRLGVNMDITDRKQAEAAVARTNDLLSRAEQIGHIGSFSTDIATGQVNWSEGLYSIFGLEPGTIEPSLAEFLARVHPDDRAGAGAAVARAFQERGALEVENRIVLPDGQMRTMYTRGEVTPDKNGQPTQLLGLTIDITERKLRERQLEVIAAVGAALRAADTHAKMLPIILEQVTALLDANAATVTLRDPATSELVIAAGWGNLAPMVGRRLPAGAGIAGHVIATGQPYVTSNVNADPYFHAWAQVDQMPAAVCAPLVTEAYTLGALWVGRAEPFTDGDVRVLSAIADIAANAMQRAQLHEQTQQQLSRLSALREIDDAIIGSLDLRVTLSIILPAVTSQLGVSAAAVLLLNRGDQMLEYAAGDGFLTSAIQKSRLRRGEGYPGQALLERQVVSVADLKAAGSQFLRAGLLAAERFASYFCAPLVAKGQVVGVLELFHRGPLNPNAEWLDFLQTLAGQTAIAVADARQFADLQRSNADMVLAYDTTLEGWSAALDLRDKETEGHSQRVTEITLELAQAMGVAESELEHIRRGSLLHDIGKMGVPDAVLLKPAKLTDDEWVIMRKHPVYAFQLLSPISFLRQALDIPYCHHEKWDGTGYPRQLKGEAIPLAARIFAVVDVWDALRSTRPYRPGWTDQRVRDHIRSLSGTHFDPRVVTAFLALHLAESLELELA